MTDHIADLLRHLADEMEAQAEPDEDGPLDSSLKAELASWLLRAVYDLGYCQGRVAEREAQVARKREGGEKLGSGQGAMGL